MWRYTSSNQIAFIDLQIRAWFSGILYRVWPSDMTHSRLSWGPLLSIPDIGGNSFTQNIILINDHIAKIHLLTLIYGLAYHLTLIRWECWIMDIHGWKLRHSSMPIFILCGSGIPLYQLVRTPFWRMYASIQLGLEFITLLTRTSNCLQFQWNNLGVIFKIN